MNIKRIIILLSLASTVSHAGILKGITETGDEVILREDGTWSYVHPDEVETEVIDLNPAAFTKPVKNTFPVKSRKNNCEVWIDAKKWTFEKSTGGATEYDFELRGEDAYAMMINEAIQMELEYLAEVAVENARDAAPDVNVVRKEYRIVNGNKVIFMQMAGTISGMKFTYLGYYYSDPSGTTQLVAYTGTSLVDQYRAELENLLNGLMVKAEPTE